MQSQYEERAQMYEQKLCKSESLEFEFVFFL